MVWFGTYWAEQEFVASAINTILEDDGSAGYILTFRDEQRVQYDGP